MLNFVDNQIDKTTGTVTAQVMVENADETLWPGLAVSVDLTVETRKDIVSVPASAVLPAQQGMIVWVVGADNKVAVRPVVQERVIGQIAYLAERSQARRARRDRRPVAACRPAPRFASAATAAGRPAAAARRQVSKTLRVAQRNLAVGGAAPAKRPRRRRSCKRRFESAR